MGKESITKQSFIDLGFTDTDLSCDKSWCLEKMIQFESAEGVKYTAAKIIQYDLVQNLLSISYVGNPFGVQTIVKHIKVINKEELDWVWKRVKGGFLEKE